MKQKLIRIVSDLRNATEIQVLGLSVYRMDNPRKHANEILAKRRSKAIKKFLIGRGITVAISVSFSTVELAKENLDPKTNRFALINYSIPVT